MSYATVRTILSRFSIKHLWALIILTGVFIFVNTHPIRPHDFWWHIAVGKAILENGQIPLVDIYSYTAYATPYPSYQVFWLMEILLYSIFRAGGAALIVFIQSLVLTSAYLLVLLTCLHQSNDWRVAAFSTAFAVALGINDWNVRPQVISFLLGAVFLYLIQRLRSGLNPAWAIILPLLMVIWVNSHGTFLLGILFVSLWMGEELWRLIIVRWKVGTSTNFCQVLVPGLILLITTLACFVNPAGFGILKYLRTLLGHSVVQNLVVEWAPPKMNTLVGGLFFTSLLMTGIILVFSPRRPTFFHLLGFLAMALLSCLTSRGIIWYGMVMAPVVAGHSHALWVHVRRNKDLPKNYQGKPLINWMFLCVIFGLGIITLPWFKEHLPMPELKAGLISRETPIQATEYILQNHSPGKMFHAMSFGSFLIWAAYPEYQVFVDSRIELYPLAIWQDYLEISNAVGDWEEKLDRYGVNTLMLSQIEQPGLVEAVLSTDRWELVFSDHSALVFVSR